jgi:hypothetical protein
VNTYSISNLLPVHDAVLLNDVYLVLLYANRIPPHLLIAINGKTFTLSVKGASVDGELAALLTLIRKKNIETIFIRLSLPALFTLDQLKEQIRACTLAYPSADIGIATCLSPIKDFCHSIYETEKQNVNLIFDLLPQLQAKNIIKECYQINLNHLVKESNTFKIKIYQVNDVFEAIRESSLV